MLSKEVALHCPSAAIAQASWLQLHSPMQVAGHTQSDCLSHTNLYLHCRHSWSRREERHKVMQIRRSSALQQVAQGCLPSIHAWHRHAPRQQQAQDVGMPEVHGQPAAASAWPQSTHTKHMSQDTVLTPHVLSRQIGTEHMAIAACALDLLRTMQVAGPHRWLQHPRLSHPTPQATPQLPRLRPHSSVRRHPPQFDTMSRVVHCTQRQTGAANYLGCAGRWLSGVSQALCCPAQKIASNLLT